MRERASVIYIHGTSLTLHDGRRLALIISYEPKELKRLAAEIGSQKFKRAKRGPFVLEVKETRKK